MPLRDVSITHLALARSDFRPRPTSKSGVSFAHVHPPMPELNRFFYAAIGGTYYWLDRRPWTLSQWADYLRDETEIETWVLGVKGVPAGYVELGRRPDSTIEIVYFGLLPQFVGAGLGGHLLTVACERAFAMGSERVILNTCDLDHPKALANYMARGFRVVGNEVKRKEVPATPPGPWDGSR